MTARFTELGMFARRASTFAAMLIALLFAAPAPAADPPAARRNPIGQIKKVTGSASIGRDGQHLAATPGQAVYQGDVLETGPDGSVGIALADNSLFSAGPSSELALPEFKFDTNTSRGSMLASLRKGTLNVVSGAITHTTPGAMSIRTPTAILGVRGTTFAVEVVAIGLCQCVSDYTAPHIRCLPNAHYCQTACGSTHYSFVPASRSEIAACPPDERFPDERYVVLPNADGRPGSGAITVSYGTTATTLDQPYAAAEMRDGQASSVAMPPSEAQNIFQDAFAARPLLPAHFSLDFQLGTDRMTAESAALYRTVLAEIKKRQVYDVELVGHTDLAANDARNPRLSLDRAVAIRQDLVRDGVNPQAIRVEGRGAAEPVVRKVRGAVEPRNRRVDVSIR